MEQHSHPNPSEDPFRPPTASVEVMCLHCGSEYESDQLQWREVDFGHHRHGCWCCPMPGCQGSGFGFDILPANPAFYEEAAEWFSATESEETLGAEEAWEEDWNDEVLSLSEATSRPVERDPAADCDLAADMFDGFPWKGAGRDAPPIHGPQLRLYIPPQE